jgi:hypothetical protein
MVILANRRWGVHKAAQMIAAARNRSECVDFFHCKGHRFNSFAGALLERFGRIFRSPRAG